jgi:hypothetical protein
MRKIHPSIANFWLQSKVRKLLLFYISVKRVVVLVEASWSLKVAKIVGI